MNLRVLSYNIHKGFSIGNRNFVLQQIKEAIRSVEADIVFLQEVLGHHDEHARKLSSWPLEPQFEYLADEVWPHFAYGKNCVYEAGHHGNAILSRYPIHSVRNIDISTNPFERRGMLHAVVTLGQSSQLHLMCVHLNLLRRGREAQVLRLSDRIRAEVDSDAKVIIAGDFNDWSARISHILERETGTSEVHRTLYGKYALTYPSRYPLLRLDRIYSKGLVQKRAKVLTGKPWSNLSDHAALYAEFELL
jgi:endonuclease/exonuclease/phosphatase family metal-dependent hydrolase